MTFAPGHRLLGRTPAGSRAGARPRRPQARSRALRAVACWIALLPALAGSASAQTLTNVASGTTGDVPLDAARARISLTRASSVATSVVGEIAPNEVLVRSVGNRLTIDILPLIGPLDLGVSRIEITAPTGFTGLSVEEVYRGGVRQGAKPSNPGNDEYTATVAGQLMTVLLGEKVASPGMNIRIVFTADAPSTAGSAAFTALVADGPISDTVSPGDADGNPSDANSLTVEVVFTQGSVLTLAKEANKRRAAVGETVTYTVTVANTAATDVLDVWLADALPPDFKYVEKSARLNGAPLAEPSGDRSLRFPIGTVAGLVDGDGNGEADPGEIGHLTLVYRLVVGSGATPGTYENVAVAKDYCEACAISNSARAEVEVARAPEFELGTIIGKVFLDGDRDGGQDPGEPGVPGAVVALDDGTYAVTDEHGRYHFPAVAPGQRMVKVNLGSLPGRAVAATEESHILSVTPAILAKANFGVLFEQVTERIGHPGTPAIALVSERGDVPIDVLGNVQTLSVVVNGRALPLPSGGVQMRMGDLEEAVQISGDGLESPIRFQLDADGRGDTAFWRLVIRDATGAPIRAIEGEGPPPLALTWDGRDDRGHLVHALDVYSYQLERRSVDGSASTGPRRIFGVNRKSIISLDLAGEAFEPGSDRLSPQARLVLTEAASVLRRHPEEKVVIEGHTDDTGSTEFNTDLSRRRAEAAVAFLTRDMKLPESQFTLRWYGETRPRASNDLAEGRAVNRRVELRGEAEEVETAPITDQYRTESSVRINGRSLPVDGEGRFATRVDDPDATSLAIEITNSEDRSARATLPIPRLEILEPSGVKTLSLGTSADAWQAVSLAETDGGGARFRVAGRVVGRTDPGSTVELDGHALSVSPDGRFEAGIELAPGTNTFGFVARNPEGCSRIVNLEVTASDREADGDPVRLSDAVPSLTVALPPPGAILRTNELSLSGATDPGNSVHVNERPLIVRPDGRFDGTVELPRGRSAVTVRVTDPDGQVGTITRDVEVERGELFLLAFASAEYGRLEANGFIEGAGMDEPDEYYSDGRVAYYLKGLIAGKYLITSAFDTGREEFEDVFKDLDEVETDRLLRNLDPDRFYPVYGDGSEVVYDAESEGKLYLAVDGDELHLLVGNYPVDLTDVELSAYQRTLYGGRFVYRSVSRTEFGDPDTKIVLFGSDARHIHVRDELRATGGSLYYLSHRDVVEGSEQVTLIVRDKNTGLMLVRRAQAQNTDYTIKYEEGRLMFRRPISSVLRDDRLIDAEILSGNPVHVQIDYEVRPDAFDETSAGGRIRQQLGDRVAVGGTLVDDNSAAGSYRLRGVDSEFRIGAGARIVGEYAESEGNDASLYVSDDGGLSYAPASGDGGRRGVAWKTATKIDVGEWFHSPGNLIMNGYYKKLEPGFFSSGNFLEQGTEKFGIGADVRLGSSGTLLLRHDRDDRLGGDAAAGDGVESVAATSAEWRLDRERWGTAAEFRRNETDGRGARSAQDNSVGGARVWMKPLETLRARVERQQTLDGPRNDQTTLGVEYQMLPQLALDLEGVEGTRGRSAQGGAVLALGESRVYVSERLLDDPIGDEQSTVVGAESSVGRSTKAYTEYQWVRSDRGPRTISLLGLQRQFEVTPGLRVVVSGETSKIDAKSVESTRSAVGGTVAYGRPGLSASSRNEVRFDDGRADQVQFYTQNQVDLRVVPDFTLLGRYRYSRSRDRGLDVTLARLVEGSVGLAYRPVRHDRLNGLARYTRLLDLRPSALVETPGTERTMDVISIETDLGVHTRVDWISKGAARILDEKAGALPAVKTHTYLLVQRLNLNTWRRLDLAAEYRLLRQREADDRLSGWLTELSWRLATSFRFGAGYNFTDFSDNEFSMNDYSVRGWFVRAQGRY
jgi:uncharacterized repeat protein (TIGR01451 family)